MLDELGVGGACRLLVFCSATSGFCCGGAAATATAAAPVRRAAAAALPDRRRRRGGATWTRGGGASCRGRDVDARVARGAAALGLRFLRGFGVFARGVIWSSSRHSSKTSSRKPIAEGGSRALRWLRALALPNHFGCGAAGARGRPGGPSQRVGRAVSARSGAGGAGGRGKN